MDMASDPSTSPRGAQKRGKKTREAIVIAAIRTITQSDIYSLRLSQVAKEAGVQQSLVDYYFKDLEALMMEMVLYQLFKLKTLSIAAIEQNSTNPREALAAYIRAPFALSKVDTGFRAVWSIYYHLAVVKKAFGDLNKSVRQTGHDRIQMLIQNIVLSEGRMILKVGQDSSRVASAIQGMITGCGFIASSETDGDFEQMAGATIESSLQLIESTFPKAG